MSSNYLQSTQQPTDFRPSSDRVCTACNEARVDQYPAVRYCNVKAGRRPCLPYSQIDDTLLPNCGLQNLQHGLDTALIYGSYDSPLVPESQLLAQHGREHELQSRGMTSTTGRSDPKRRPVILFPKKKAVKKQFACLMGTFDGGYIYGRTTRSFAYGVWPTIVDPLHGLGSHIHTTPRWESARSEEGNELPQFVLAIEYKPDHCDKPWRHSVTYHLDAGTTEFLSTLCIQMVRKWVRETSSAPPRKRKRVEDAIPSLGHQGYRNPVTELSSYYEPRFLKSRKEPPHAGPRRPGQPQPRRYSRDTYSSESHKAPESSRGRAASSMARPFGKWTISTEARMDGQASDYKRRKLDNDYGRGGLPPICESPVTGSRSLGGSRSSERHLISTTRSSQVSATRGNYDSRKASQPNSSNRQRAYGVADGPGHMTFDPDLPPVPLKLDRSVGRDGLSSTGKNSSRYNRQPDPLSASLYATKDIHERGMGKFKTEATRTYDHVMPSGPTFPDPGVTTELPDGTFSWSRTSTVAGTTKNGASGSRDKKQIEKEPGEISD